MALCDFWRAAGRSFAQIDEEGQVVEITPTWIAQAARGGFCSSGPILGQNFPEICPHWARTKVKADWQILLTGDKGLKVIYPVDRPIDQRRWFILVIEKEASANGARTRFMVMLVSVLELFEDRALMGQLERHAGISRELILVDILRHGIVNLRLDS